jgi:predicted nucleic acid-binding protein
VFPGWNMLKVISKALRYGGKSMSTLRNRALEIVNVISKKKLAEIIDFLEYLKLRKKLKQPMSF